MYAFEKLATLAATVVQDSVVKNTVKYFSLSFKVPSLLQSRSIA
jgi:hypothetical protein